MAYIDKFTPPNSTVVYDIKDTSSTLNGSTNITVTAGSNNSKTISLNDTVMTGEVQATEIQAGDLIVTGASRFLNTINGSVSGSATSLATARTIQTNLASTAAASFDGTSNVTPGVTGTLGVGNGGTGQTNGANAANYFINSLRTGDSVPVDTDYYVSQYVGGSQNTFHRRPVSKLNDYIKGKADTTVTQNSTNLITSGAVFNAIDNLPEPMIFKGTLGTNGTITALPTAAATNEGFTYKVITAGTYASQAAKVGDVFTSNGSEWVYIPSGDDVEDSWRNIKVNGTEKLSTAISSGAIDFVNGTNTTVNFNASGNKISINSSWRGIQDNLTSSTNTTESLSAKQGYLLANGSARDDTKLPLAGGNMTGASGIQFPTTSGNNKTGNWISAGGGYGTGSGKSGVKIIACEQTDAVSGLGQDCGGLSGGYELSIIAPESTGGVAYISFLKHKIASPATYTKLGYFNSSGDLVTTGSVYEGGTKLSSKYSAIGHTHAAEDIAGGYLNTQPENGPVLIPFVNNDLAFMLSRGGSIIVQYDGVTQSLDMSGCFDGSPTYGYGIGNSGDYTTITMELTLHRTFSWTNSIYVDFGNSGWRAKSVKIEVMNSNYSEDVWTQKYNTTTNGSGHIYIVTSHQPVGASNTGGGFNKIRYTFSNFNHSSIFRIAQLGVYNYSSAGSRETYMSRGVDDAIFRSITPAINNTYQLGGTNNKWSSVYATNFYGALTGNVTGNCSGDAGTVNGHTVAKDVPSNAVFTDTTYSCTTGTALTGATFSAGSLPSTSSVSVSAISTESKTFINGATFSAGSTPSTSSVSVSAITTESKTFVSGASLSAGSLPTLNITSVSVLKGASLSGGSTPSTGSKTFVSGATFSQGTLPSTTSKTFVTGVSHSGGSTPTTGSKTFVTKVAHSGGSLVSTESKTFVTGVSHSGGSGAVTTTSKTFVSGTTFSQGSVPSTESKTVVTGVTITLPTLTYNGTDTLTFNNGGSTVSTMSMNHITGVGSTPQLTTASASVNGVSAISNIPNVSVTTASVNGITNIGSFPGIATTTDTVNGVTNVGSMPSVSVTTATVNGVSGVGSLPTLTTASASVNGVTGVGSMPTLSTSTTSVVAYPVTFSQGSLPSLTTSSGSVNGVKTLTNNTVNSVSSVGSVPSLTTASGTVNGVKTLTNGTVNSVSGRGSSPSLTTASGTFVSTVTKN